ncbi:MAG: hypothetical protein IPM53_26995 [Anaerolineaceae bacterium]|nr:hypothetical protein [Anaerolineaceae bacterium]
MDASDILVKALAAGATAALRPNRMYLPDFQKEIMPLYLQLKALLEERYGSTVNVDLLDIGPGSAERQEAMAQQLQASGAANDEDVMQLARKLVAIITDENPESIWASNVAEPPEHLK